MMIPSAQLKKDHAVAVFDMDGVIIDSGPLHMEAWKMTLQALNERNSGEGDTVVINDERFRMDFGMRDTEVVPRLMGLLDDAEIAELLDHKSTTFQQLVREQGQTIDGLEEFLGELVERNVRAVLASLARPEEIQTVLDALGLSDKLDVVITREHKMRDKPSPDIYLTAAYRLGVSPDVAVVFEDAVSGVEAARKAGATTVALTTSYDAGSLSHADLVVENFHEPLLRDLF